MNPIPKADKQSIYSPSLSKPAAIPNLFSTLMSSATVIFDLWYVGLIGMSELAGVAYIFPIFMLTSMLSNGAFGGAISGAVD